MTNLKDICIHIYIYIFISGLRSKVLLCKAGPAKVEPCLSPRKAGDLGGHSYL